MLINQWFQGKWLKDSERSGSECLLLEGPYKKEFI